MRRRVRVSASGVGLGLCYLQFEQERRPLGLTETGVAVDVDDALGGIRSRQLRHDGVLGGVQGRGRGGSARRDAGARRG